RAHRACARDPRVQPAARRLVPPHHPAAQDRPSLHQGAAGPRSAGGGHRVDAGRACRGGAVGSPALAFEAQATPATAPSPWGIAARRFAADRWALAGCAFLIALHLVAIAAPWGLPQLFHRSAFRQRMNEPVHVAGHVTDVVSEDGIPVGPCAIFPMGADLAGRDVLARVVYGSRVSLLVATLGTLLALALGLAAGLLAGLYRGAIDTLISRFVDAMMA